MMMMEFQWICCFLKQKTKVILLEDWIPIAVVHPRPLHRKGQVLRSPYLALIIRHQLVF